MRPILVRAESCLAALLATVACLVAASPVAAASFGAGCQQDFQNDWQKKLDYTWAQCSGFNNRLDDTDTKAFYFNLHNAKWWWEDAGDQLTLDTVNLFYANTHGGAWSDKSQWAMWDEKMLANSLQMRLGDEATGLSIFSTYACETMKFDDGRLWTRMEPLFSGGLRYATGSHDLLWDFWSTDEVGEDFAAELQSGNSIKYAWREASGDWYVDNDVTVMATGATGADCVNRRDNMTWQNFETFPRLRDFQIAWICRTSWDNI